MASEADRDTSGGDQAAEMAAFSPQWGELVPLDSRDGLSRTYVRVRD